MAMQRILCAGHDLRLLASLRARLKDCCIVRSPSGGVARVFLRGEIEYALLLLVEELPDMRGQALAILAREIKQREGMPIIILTREGKRGADAGVFYEKPYEVESVARIIKRLLIPHS